MAKFDVTFTTITPESAEHGDFADNGFIAKDVDLREAFALMSGYADEADSSFSLDNPPRSFTAYNYDENYETGEVEQRSLHLPANITPSSAMRVARLLGVFK